jgi:hypothetical protein
VMLMKSVKLIKKKVIDCKPINILGEILSVELDHFDAFHLSVGEELTCKYGAKTFKTKILKKQDFLLYLFIPYMMTKEADDQREFPRIDFKDQDVFLKISSAKHGVFPFEIKLVDLSIEGLGIQTNGELGDSEIDVEFMLNGVNIAFQAIVKNRKLLDDGFRYGLVISAIDSETKHFIRKFVLISQLQGVKLSPIE